MKITIGQSEIEAAVKTYILSIMTGGAGWKMAPSMTRPFELVDNLIFDGLLVIASHRWGG